MRRGKEETERWWDARGPAAATEHNTHCGRGWINSSEDGTLRCNPQPRIMEHRNLKDNALSEQWAPEPRRGRAVRNGDSRHFFPARAYRVSRDGGGQRHISGFILTENEAVCGNKRGGRRGRGTQLCRRPRSSLHFTSGCGPPRWACDPLRSVSFFCISWGGEWVRAHIKIQRRVKIRGCGVGMMYRQVAGRLTLCISNALRLGCISQMWGWINRL